MEPSLTKREPQHFGTREIVIGNLIAASVLAVTFPLAVASMVMILVVAFEAGYPRLGPVVGVFLYVAALVLLLPFMNNVYFARVVRKHVAKPKDGPFCAIVQITLSPRLYRGFRGLTEDADDVGYIVFSDDGIHFEGDSVSLTIPYEAIDRIQDTNVGYRGLWVASRRIRVFTKAIPRYEYFEFLDREGLRIKTSRLNAARIVRKLMMETQLSA